MGAGHRVSRWHRVPYLVGGPPAGISRSGIAAADWHAPLQAHCSFVSAACAWVATGVEPSSGGRPPVRQIHRCWLSAHVLQCDCDSGRTRDMVACRRRAAVVERATTSWMVRRFVDAVPCWSPTGRELTSGAAGLLLGVGQPAPSATAQVGSPQDGGRRPGWLPAVGGVPATVGWPLTDSGVPAGVGPTARCWAGYRWRIGQRGSAAVGGVAATVGRPLRVGRPPASGPPPGGGRATGGGSPNTARPSAGECPLSVVQQPLAGAQLGVRRSSLGGPVLGGRPSARRVDRVGSAATCCSVPGSRCTAESGTPAGRLPRAAGLPRPAVVPRRVHRLQVAEPLEFGDCWGPRRQGGSPTCGGTPPRAVGHRLWSACRTWAYILVQMGAAPHPI
jgi:hypothetical protein